MWDPSTTTSIIGLVVEFIVAIDEARVRFTDDALLFSFYFCSFCSQLLQNSMRHLYHQVKADFDVLRNRLLCIDTVCLSAPSSFPPRSFWQTTSSVLLITFDKAEIDDFRRRIDTNTNAFNLFLTNATK